MAITCQIEFKNHKLKQKNDLMTHKPDRLLYI